MYRQILITLNYSNADTQLIAKAALLAQPDHAKISLIHVLDNIAMPDTAYGTRIFLDKPTDYIALETEKNRLINAAKALAIEHANCWLIWGTPHQEIIHLAETLSTDLILVGAHTKHGFSLLTGSTANSLLQQAKCDVLSVHLPH